MLHLGQQVVIQGQVDAHLQAEWPYKSVASNIRSKCGFTCGLAGSYAGARQGADAQWDCLAQKAASAGWPLCQSSAKFSAQLSAVCRLRGGQLPLLPEACQPAHPVPTEHVQRCCSAPDAAATSHHLAHKQALDVHQQFRNPVLIHVGAVSRLNQSLAIMSQNAQSRLKPLTMGTAMSRATSVPRHRTPAPSCLTILRMPSRVEP